MKSAGGNEKAATQSAGAVAAPGLQSRMRRQSKTCQRRWRRSWRAVCGRKRVCHSNRQLRRPRGRQPGLHWRRSRTSSKPWRRQPRQPRPPGQPMLGPAEAEIVREAARRRQEVRQPESPDTSRQPRLRVQPRRSLPSMGHNQQAHGQKRITSRGSRSHSFPPMRWRQPGAVCQRQRRQPRRSRHHWGSRASGGNARRDSAEGGTAGWQQAEGGGWNTARSNQGEHTWAPSETALAEV